MAKGKRVTGKAASRKKSPHRHGVRPLPPSAKGDQVPHGAAGDSAPPLDRIRDRIDSVDSQLQQILSAEQLAAADAMGFDLVEYLAVTAPWETLNPPPTER